jgi:hypothetical protein
VVYLELGEANVLDGRVRQEVELASFAEYDRENIAERTQAGLHRAFRNGKQLGSIPFGYDVVAEGDLDGAFFVVEEEPGSSGRSSPTSLAAAPCTRRPSA